MGTDTVRLLGASFIFLLVGCSSSTGATNDGGVTDAAYDTTVPNTCAMAGFVCQASCSAGLIDEQDYVCGASADYCCAPAGEGGTDASNDVNVFVDGAVFEAGDDAAEDASGDDATADDAAEDAKPDTDHPTDASKPIDGSLDASGSTTPDAKSG
jgi:hypothetical protein